ncbi:sulfite exporter TauE/SafE family protein [Marinobacterium rhizophilum]|uniref:sulfite exporter TauE/SafE family protein n=1 Tax=Marinobacterium rhizophilum TaxID=420402 RepID=UPI00037EA84F|nr:sulfite exporter TauE/SafE family protein [Marinobacterium rhizophilum]
MDAGTLMFSPWLLLAIFVIVTLGTVVQSGLGMGFGLVAAPLLALIDPVLVPVPALFMGMLTSVWAALHERPSIRWNEVGVGVAGRFTGVLAATLVLASMADPKFFMLVFGMLIVMALLLSLSGWQLAFSRRALFGMANLSGFMATITSVGAPPMALLYQGRPAGEARPTLSAFFALGGVVSLAGLYLSGWAGLRETQAAAMLLPPMLLGLYIARRLKGRFDSRYRAALLLMSGFAALLLIFRGLS